MKIAAIVVLLFVGISITVAHAQMLLLHVGPGSFGGSVPPSSCDGSIDLSTGCVMPMLR